MKLKTLSAMLLAAFGFGGAVTRGVYTKDVAFTYRMGGSFPGEISRVHPFSAIAGLTNTTNPIKRYGDGALNDGANGYRCLLATDHSDSTPIKIAGALVRPYPTQQTTGGMTSTIGAATPPVSGVQDFLQDGFITVQIPTGQTTVKGGAVYVWCAADSGSHKLGGFENVASVGNTVQISNAEFNGAADASGFVEIRIFS